MKSCINYQNSNSYKGDVNMQNNLALIKGGKNQLEQVFTFGAARVRTVVVDGEPWFVAKDVLKVLEIGRSQIQRLEDNQKAYFSLTHTNWNGVKQQRKTLVVNKHALKELTLRNYSKPEALFFKRWLLDEVLPAIGKTGTYSLQPQLPLTYKEALEEIIAQIEEKEILEQKVKMLAVENEVLASETEDDDYILDIDGAFDVGIVARTLRIPGIGRNGLFESLRSWGHLMKGDVKGEVRNVPYHKYIQAGLYKVHCLTKTNVTPKGVEYIKNRMLKEGQKLKGKF